VSKRTQITKEQVREWFDARWEDGIREGYEQGQRETLATLFGVSPEAVNRRITHAPPLRGA
jgi:flagellar biosynthesis/type III secretory pathway protein FliH